jgi:hypothetical protein
MSQAEKREVENPRRLGIHAMGTQDDVDPCRQALLVLTGVVLEGLLR